MKEQTLIRCSDCGEQLDEDIHGGSNKVPCPKCGSTHKTITMNFVDKIPKIRENLRGRVKDMSRPSKEKLRQDFFDGDDFHHKSGKWNYKTRLIDRDNDLYREEVTDPETGEVIHFCEEPLSEHRGHGTAKRHGKEPQPREGNDNVHPHDNEPNA